jgi:hypothetical protein
MKLFPLLLLPALLSPLPASFPRQDETPPTAELEAAFAAEGLILDIEGGTLAVPTTICIRTDLLEYVLVAAFGAAHESLLATETSATVLNTALVALGAKPGKNVQWIEKTPAPTPEEVRDGAPTHDVIPPSGDLFLPYCAWREGEEVYFFRLEDLITNLRTGKSMQRHGWVYLGSRMVKPRPEEEQEILAAEMEGNLINLSFFRAGNTLFSAALDDCLHQTIWLPNSALVPERGAPVTLIFSRERLKCVPPELEEKLLDAGTRE